MESGDITFSFFYYGNPLINVDQVADQPFEEKK
jgi:hypothetical protein